ncbi:uncharacterized protein LOC115216684 [Octopus sinensis]|uniref:Uncharacterized protein LOC115216684 n=1 Tax=Octopus sinensis TaxID=2607531 RepID=A0A6P7SUV9_9MOLL|nr:uncharacterized protein LOC115216684 [Octopus sinensis]
MAFLSRCFYRRKRIIVILSFVSMFWVIYLYLSIPSPTTGKTQEHVNHIKEIITLRKIISTTVHTKSLSQVPIKFTKPSKPPLKNITKNETIVKKSQLDKVLQIGETLKNKTLEKLSAIGVIKTRPVIKFISESFKLDLNITMIDLADFMKDTHNLNQVKLTKGDIKKNIPLQNNSTKTVSNGTAASLLTNSFCRCFHVQCVCCAWINMTRLHLSEKACANFTLLPKFQEFAFRFVFNNKLVYNQTITAENPPLICLGSKTKAAEICVKFSNVTFQVNVHEEHKTQLNGCASFNLNLFNRTIGVYPVGCFQIPDNNKHLERNQLGNWMP